MVSQLHVKRRRGPFQHRPSKVDNKNKNVYVKRQSDNVLFQLSGQDDLKNMISPSSSNANQNVKEVRNERSLNLSKLEQLNQVSNQEKMYC